MSCPTASIRLEKESSGPENELVTTERVKEAMEKFPSPVDVENLAGVYHLGYHSKKSFGATSYLVQTKAHGNIMVDCPRYTKKLAEKIKELGGISLIFLSHKDDVGDHDKWAQEFGATRIIHELEVPATRQKWAMAQFARRRFLRHLATSSSPCCAMLLAGSQQSEDRQVRSQAVGKRKLEAPRPRGRTGRERGGHHFVHAGTLLR